MKKFLALTALVLGLASCQTEPEGLDINVGGAVNTEITVSLPETETRAGGSNSATSDINAILATDDYTMRYMLQVFYGDKPSELYVRYSDNQKVSFPVRLVPGEDRDYNFVVWADIVEQVAGLEDDVKCDDLHYAIGADLREISVIDNEWVAMDETRDAFTAVKLVENYTGSQAIDIDLYRPFAKLRVITTDMVELTKHDIIPTTAVVTYKTKHRVAYNALTGEAADASATKEHSYTIAAYGDNTETDRVLFTDYFFADDEVVKFEMLVKDQDGKEIVTRSFNTDIFVKRNYLTTLKGDILTNGTDVNVTVKPGFDGENGKVDGETFANVDTAEELFDAINKGIENITLEGDINLNDLLAAGTLSTRAGEEPAFVVAAGKKLTIDLNGYTISETKTQTAAHSMITNKGTLTIVDSKSNGKIYYRDEGNGGNYVSNTIQNSGVLTIEGGIIENNSTETVADNGFPHPIDNSGKLVINGGTFTNNANYSSMRIWCTTDDDTEVTINGGTFNGSIDLQSVNANANKGVLTINGGTFNADTHCGCAVRFLGFGVDVDEIFGYINGGTFNGKIKLNNYVGGEFNSQVFFITGGTFAENPSSQNGIDYVVKGYKAEQENGVYVVRKPQALIDFENAIANGDNVTLSEDLTLIDPVAVPEGKEVTINLNGKTLDIYTHKSVGGVLKNNGTLAIEGGVISSKANNGGSAIANNGTLTIKNATLNGAPNADGGWPSYTVNNTGTMTLENSTITSKHGAVCSYGEGAVLTLNNCTLDMAGIAGVTSHGIYTYNGGKVVVNGGTYVNNATDQNATGASVINGNVEVNAGTFTGRIENYYGTPVLKGGTYSVKPKDAFVAEGYKVVQSGDKYMVVKEDVVGVATDNTTLETAVDNAQNGDTIALSTGDYDATQITNIAGKTISFVGNGEDTVFDYNSQGYNTYVSGGNGNFTFENMTINRSTETFAGMAHTNSTVYKNCVINGVYFVYEKSAQFIDCTFNITGNNYNCWLYGTSKATYTNCTFNCDGKSIYVDGNGDTGSDAEFNNCVFNDINKVVTDKAAVETGTTYGKRYELIFNNTTVNGFNINPNGIVTGSTLWANKHSMTADKLKVTVDGYTWVADGLSQKDGEYYVSNANGLNYFSNVTAANGTVIKLAADIDMNGVEFKAIAAGYSKSLTFDGQNHTIKNVKIATCSHNSVGAAGLFFCYTGGTLNVSNLVVEKATSVGATYAGAITGYTQGNATLTNITVKECNISGVKKIGGIAGFVEASTTNFVAENCKVIDTTVAATEKQAGTIIGYNAKPATLKNCTVENSTATAPQYCDGGVRSTDPTQAELTIE